MYVIMRCSSLLFSFSVRPPLPPYYLRTPCIIANNVVHSLSWALSRLASPSSLWPPRLISIAAGVSRYLFSSSLNYIMHTSSLTSLSCDETATSWLPSYERGASHRLLLCISSPTLTAPASHLSLTPLRNLASSSLRYVVDARLDSLSPLSLPLSETLCRRAPA